MQTKTKIGWFLSLALFSLAMTAEAASLLTYRSSGWKYVLGTVEASNPVDAWRTLEFDDSAWLPAAAPIGYPSSDAGPLELSRQTTLPTSSLGGYTCVFLRKTFVVSNIAEVVQLNLTAQHDDGFAAWVNGTEVGRANVPAGPLTIASLGTDHEVTVGEAALNLSTTGVLVEGTNVLAVQLFNSGSGSSDIFIDVALESVLDQAPVVLAIDPTPGTIQLDLNFITVTFNENVTGVDVSDLLINGVATSTAIQQVSPREYQFNFPAPPTGTVNVAWSSDPGIADTDGVPNGFVPGAGWSYTVDPNALPTAAIISEFMTDNVSGIRDEDGDRRDWIEVYNPGAVDINLSGYYLTDTATNLTKWRFPSVNLGSRRHLLVWASEKNRTNAASPLHTNFRLGKDVGGYLALSNPQGQVISEFASYPAQAQDVSYGRDPAEPDLVGYFVAPTPGTLNVADSSNVGFAAEPVFSHVSGVYADASITLTITTTPPGQTVRYTLDGSEPINTSPSYAGPITFATNMMIKVRAYSADPTLWPSRVVARNFVMLDASARDFNSNLPILIMTSHGRTVLQSIAPGGTRPRGTFVAIDTFRGRSSIRGTPDYQGLAQFEIVGQTSAGFAKQPWRFELNDELGNDRDASFLGLPAEADWLLRNPHNDKTLMNDFLGYELWAEMGHYSCRSRYVEVFVQTTAGGKLQYPRDYYGVMVLFERIQIGENRVDIAKLTPSHTTEPGISGGYIIKKDKDSAGDTHFTTPGGLSHSGHTLKFHDPKPREISITQSNWIRNYVLRFEASMYNTGWTNAIGTNHYSHYVDVDAFVDQHLHVEFTKQIDGYRLSSYYSKDRNGKLKPDPVWDWNLAFGNANYLQGGKTNGWYWNVEGEGMNSSTHIWLRRMIYGLPTLSGVAPYTINNGPGDPDFRQKITDRWSLMRQSVLNGDRVVGRINELNTLLTESAGRNWTKYPGVLNAYQWPNPEGPPSWDVDFTKVTYAEIVEEMKKWTKGRFLWMDSQFLLTPSASQTPGPITPGTSVALAGSGGTIYYTLDGTDPRLPGGGISPSAQVYSGPIALNNNARLIARSYSNPTPLWTPWSAPADATYVVQTPRLVITEIMYHPQPSATPSSFTDEDFEYIELKNVGTTPLRLAGFSISGGVEFTFPVSPDLQPGSHVVVAKNQAAFTSRYGSSYRVAGQYTGNLANEGNRLVLQGPYREPILDFTYDDQWYPITDGFGFSLVIANENAPLDTWGLATNWRPSGTLDGSPGKEEDPAPVIPRVVISEALTHSDPPPLVDTIELSNLTDAPVDVSGWFLTDDFRNPKKFRIPQATIPAHSEIIFTEADFNADGDGNIPFALSSLGDELYLFSGDAEANLTGYVHGFDYGAQSAGVTFGRYVTSTGEDHFVALTSSTLGQPNTAPHIGPIVISEIMYRPPDILANGAYWNDTEDEYVELRNISTGPVTLSSGTNRWKLDNAVEFSFPQGLTIPVGGYVVAVSFDPIAQAAQAAAFRSKYGIGASVALVGPYQGSLDNDAENVALYRPDPPDTNGVIPFVLVDGVRYRDSVPWSSDADGLGQSLQRINPDAYGDDPVNWTAGGPSPGSGFTPGTGPTILGQPASVVVQDSGTASATFTGSAFGPGPLRYQWLFNGKVLNGATGSTLTLQNIQPAQAGEYRLVVMNPFGAAVSAPATLTVLILPKLTLQPADQKVAPGVGVSFAVIATTSNPPLSYQWYRDGRLIPGATASFYTINNVQDSNEGLYYATVTDNNGTVTTRQAELKVLLVPTLVQPVPPVRITAVAGENITMGVQTRGTKPMLYRWRRVLSSGGGLIMTNRTLNLNYDFFTLPNVGTNLNNAYFQIILTNEAYTAQNLLFTNAYISVLEDSNSNGLPDQWEQTHFGSPTGADRNADSDGDTMSNYQEYIAGTNPRDAASYLKVAQITATGPATISFLAASNRTYTVEYKDGLDAGVWNRLSDVVGRSIDWNASVTDLAPGTNRHYRLVTPKR